MTDQSKSDGKYQILKDMGLDVTNKEHGYFQPHWVNADDLLKLINGAAKVQGMFNSAAIDFSNIESEEHTHTALLINIKPIERPKPLTKTELISWFKKSRVLTRGELDDETRLILERIESSGIGEG